jgi:hypothetical protein
VALMNPRRETGATFVRPTTSDVMVVSKLIGIPSCLWWCPGGDAFADS